MGEEIIQTDVDRLIDILKIKKKMDLSKLSKELNIPEKIIQKWVEFLVEEKIISIEYTFTSPILTIIEDEKKKEMTKQEFSQYKQKFIKDAKYKKEGAEQAWKQHVLESLGSMKPFFYSEVEKRGLKKSDELWHEYKRKVIQS